jgi:hypothetical protein
MSESERAVVIADAVHAVAEELAPLTERLDAALPLLERIAVALERLARQHEAASYAAYGSAYSTALREG